MPYSLEALESIPVQAMEDKQCETFLKGKTKQLHRDIVCAPDFGLNSELDHFKVATMLFLTFFYSQLIYVLGNRTEKAFCL